MRFVYGLLMLAVVWFIAQGVFNRSRSRTLLAEATAMLPQDPRKARQTMQPVFGYSNIPSLGAVGRARSKFFDNVRDKMVGSIRDDTGLYPGWIGIVVINLDLLHEEDGKNGIELKKHQLDILEAARQAEPHLKETAGLSAWDNYARMMVHVGNKDLVPADAADYQAWAKSLAGADRRAIGMRETLQLAQTALNDGIRALGASPASSPADPPVVLLKRPMSSEALQQAEGFFHKGEQVVASFMKVFSEKEIPPELQLVWAKVTFNHASMRVAHLIDEGPNLGQQASAYLVGMYVKTNNEAIPTDGELYGSFINTVGQQLNLASQIFQRQAAQSGGDALIYTALGYWTQGGYWTVTNRPPMAENTANLFASAKAEASSVEGAESIFEIIGAADYPMLIVN